MPSGTAVDYTNPETEILDLIEQIRNQKRDFVVVI